MNIYNLSIYYIFFKKIMFLDHKISLYILRTFLWIQEVFIPLAYYERSHILSHILVPAIANCMHGHASILGAQPGGCMIRILLMGQSTHGVKDGMASIALLSLLLLFQQFFGEYSGYSSTHTPPPF